MNEALILTFDPFAGDEGGGGGGDRVLSDKIVTARKPHECHNCGQQIQRGERVRSRSEVYDDELMSFRWCQACCEAMTDDTGNRWAEREAMRSNDRTQAQSPRTETTNEGA